MSDESRAKCSASLALLAEGFVKPGDQSGHEVHNFEYRIVALDISEIGCYEQLRFQLAQ